jgi:GntR family transcriptional regulator, transcriptional repressor for pyruvate dehydrogenase complex
MMETIKRTYLAEAVAQRLLTMIEDGELKPGDKLPPEPHLCTLLGVSRTAVREGVSALSGINVLGVFPGRGTFVNENPDIMVNNNALKIALGRETFKSLYEARYALDLGVAKFVVLNASIDDIQALQKAVDKMEESLKPGSVNISRATEADEEFHLAFYKAAHNKILESIAGPIITHTLNRTWKRQKKSPKYFRLGVKGHKKILEAVKKKYIRLTMQAIENHLEVVFKGVGGN